MPSPSVALSVFSLISGCCAHDVCLRSPSNAAEGSVETKKMGGKTLIFKSIWRTANQMQACGLCRADPPWAVRRGGGWSQGVPGQPVPAWVIFWPLLHPAASHHWQPKRQIQGWGCFPLWLQVCFQPCPWASLAGSLHRPRSWGRSSVCRLLRAELCFASYRREGTRYTVTVSLQSPFCKN